jgi:16S rRNA (adenine1518-N6/adenine1519-N6)-dimethyltransferase
VTLTRVEVARLLDEHGLRPRRALGQNFVVDPNTVRRIARLANVAPGAQVVEIGAGLGSLSLALAEAGARVVAVEVDPRLVAVLRDVVRERLPAGPGSVDVVEADALHLDWPELLEAKGSVSHRGAGAGGAALGSRWGLVANLPYNVATPLVIELLASAPTIDWMLVMVQREVAERLAAPVGTRAYGATTVKVAYWATASVIGRVPPTVFFPRPKVESALLRIERRAGPAVPSDLVSKDRLFEVVTAGFAKRRKMLRGALSSVVDPDAFAGAGIDPRARAEELSVEAWGRLAAWRAEG